MQPKEALAASVPGFQERKGQGALVFILPKVMPSGRYRYATPGSAGSRRSRTSRMKGAKPLAFILPKVMPGGRYRYAA